MPLAPALSSATKLLSRLDWRAVEVSASHSTMHPVGQLIDKH
jgi:hypothetical protein